MPSPAREERKWIIKSKEKKKTKCKLGKKPLAKRSDGRTFIDGDFLIANYANNQLVAEGPSLAEGITVAVMHHVEAAIHVHPNRPLLLLAPCALRASQPEPEQR